MSDVRIADLQANLGRHLESVQRGETITVLDHDTPIAQIVPIVTTANGVVIRPRKGQRRLSEIPLPPPCGMKRDIVELLLEDRNSGR